MQLNYHPAPGLGDLLPGFYAVPQNPIQAVTYTPRIGDILPGSFPVPQNPVKDYTQGTVRMIGSGVSGCGCSGGCGHEANGKINGIGVSGIGDWSEDWANIKQQAGAGNFMELAQAPVFGIPLFAIVGVAALLMFSGGEEHSYYGRGRRAAKAASRAW